MNREDEFQKSFMNKFTDLSMWKNLTHYEAIVMCAYFGCILCKDEKGIGTVSYVSNTLPFTKP